MSFSILYLNQTNIIVADGDITRDTSKYFRKFLATSPLDGSIFVVALNSPGGDLLGGLELGRLIRSENLHTAVLKFRRHPLSGELIRESEEPGSCFSACALAFLGGNRRELISESKLGFHQFSSAQGSLEKKDRF